MEAEPEYKVEIIKSDIPQIQITPVAKQNMEEQERTSILSPVLLQLLRSPLYKDWLVPDDDHNMAKCKFCDDKSYRLDESILKSHMNTIRHKKKLSGTKIVKVTCRTCLAKCTPKNIVSFSKVDKRNGCTYADILYSVTGIETTEHGKLPTHFCMNCRSKALDAYKFQLRAKRSDAYLQEHGGELDTQVLDDKLIESDATLKKVKKEIKYLDDETDVQENKSDDFLQDLSTQNEHDDSDTPDLAMEDDTVADPDYTDYEVLESDSDVSVKNIPVSKIKSNVQFASHKCFKCNSTFSAAKVLTRHMESCNKRTIKKEPHCPPAQKPRSSPLAPNQCRLCYETFNNALVLLHHVRTKHKNLIENKAKKSGGNKNAMLAARNMEGAIPVKVKKDLMKRGLNGMNRCRIPVVSAALPPDFFAKRENNTKPPPPPQPHLRCGVCSGLFPTEHELDLHCRDHGNTEVIMCGVCERVYFKYSQFKRHFNVHHPEMEAIVKAETTETVLEVEDADALEQLIQSLRMTTIGDLITANIPPSDEPVEIEAYVQVCGLCGCVILSPEDLQVHNQTEHPDFDTRCTLCGILFENQELLTRHVKKCQTLEKKLECLECGQMEVRESRMIKHMSLKHPDKADKLAKWLKKKREQRNFVCELCGEAFHLKSQLNAHKMTCGPDIEVQCEYCHKVFNKLFLLQRHIRNFHEKDKTEKHCLCPYCGTGFSRKGQLDIHVRRHTGYCPYKCSVEGCDKAFITSHSRTYHERRHTGKTPLVCKICNKRFIRPISLRQHMMIHTGERPYKCTQCEAGFIQSHCLVQHMKKHLGIEPSLVLDPDPFKNSPTVEFSVPKLVMKEMEESDNESKEELKVPPPSILRRKAREAKRHKHSSKRRRRLSDEDWSLPKLE